jgi:hypothetical protein
MDKTVFIHNLRQFSLVGQMQANNQLDITGHRSNLNGGTIVLG